MHRIVLPVLWNLNCARAIECGGSDSPFQRHITGVAHDSGVTHDTRFDAWECGGRSWCHGAVQEKALVPKTEVGAGPKLNRGERLPTGQLGEALWFRCRFRRHFQPSATKVPFSEPGLPGADFRLPASKVPFSEVAVSPCSQLRKLMVDGDATDNLESLHSVRLTALLHDSVKKEGRLRAARTLGVNYKTVARSIDSGRLSVHLREVLMTRLLEQSEPDAGESLPHPRRGPRALAMSGNQHSPTTNPISIQCPARHYLRRFSHSQ